jgi:hypothetical protein
MLSQDLRSLQVWFEACFNGTHEMTAEGAQAFARGLEDAVEQAEQLEQSSPAIVPVLTADELLAQARLLANATNVVLLHTSRPAFTDAPRGGAA